MRLSESDSLFSPASLNLSIISSRKNFP